MSIRPYTDADLEAILDIYALSKLDELAGEKHTFDLLPLQQDPFRFKHFQQSDITVYENEKAIVGFAGHKGNYIGWLFVHPQHRSKSVGQRLLRHLVGKLNGTISLHVARSNRKAQSLYAKFGFKCVKEFEGCYQGMTVWVNRLEYVSQNDPNI